MSKKKKRFIILLSAALLTSITCLILYSSDLADRVFRRNSGNATEGRPEMSEEQGENIVSESNEKRSEAGESNYDTGLPDPNESIPDTPLPANDAKDGRRKAEIPVTGIETHERLKTGCIADIRIRFANGEEFTVLKNIRLLVIETDDKMRVFAELDEVELLFLSSAKTDSVIYPDTLIYPSVIANSTETDGTGNYRPVKDVITLMGEEEFLDSETLERLYLTRERLEERLQAASVFYRDAVRSGLTGEGPLTETGDGYWLIN